MLRLQVGVDNLETTVENLDNAQHKNNLKICGLEETIEGKDLSGYLTDLFTSWVGSECEVELSIMSAYRVKPHKVMNKYPRDIIVKFPYWNVKAKVLESYWEQSSPIIEGSQVNIFPDISAITLRQRRNFKFLTRELQALGL